MTVPTPPGTRLDSRCRLPCAHAPLPRPRRGLPAAPLPSCCIAGGTACTGDGGGSGASDEPAAEPTPITEFDAASVALSREDFCDLIPDEAVIAAVGEVASTDHYGNGEKEPITDEVTDVAHEFSCTFVGDSGAVARAWLFVPRVTRAQAKALVADVKRARGCRSSTASPSDPRHRQRLHDLRRHGGGVSRAVHGCLVQLLGHREGPGRADAAGAGRAVVREHRHRGRVRLRRFGTLDCASPCRIAGTRCR